MGLVKNAKFSNLFPFNLIYPEYIDVRAFTLDRGLVSHLIIFSETVELLTP